MQQTEQQFNIMALQMQAAERQAATLAAALDAVRNDTAHAVRDLRDALRAEERKMDALQQSLAVATREIASGTSARRRTSLGGASAAPARRIPEPGRNS